MFVLVRTEQTSTSAPLLLFIGKYFFPVRGALHLSQTYSSLVFNIVVAHIGIVFVHIFPTNCIENFDLLSGKLMINPTLNIGGKFKEIEHGCGRVFYSQTSTKAL